MSGIPMAPRPIHPIVDARERRTAVVIMASYALSFSV